jgi:hypothetical protein
MASYSRPRLIDESDKHYRKYVEQFKLMRANQRAMRPPRQRDLFGGEAEAALRQWLGAQLPLSERRILEYEQRQGRNQVKKYRELDALSLSPPKAAQVFEIKATMRAGSLRRAVQQLRETQQILRMLFPQVSLSVLIVDTGIPTPEDIQALLADPATDPALREGRVPPPPTLDEVLAELPLVRLATSLDERPADPETISLLRFGVDDIIALAGAENLHLNWEEDEADEESPQEQSEPQKPLYTSGDEPDDDDDNPLAAALRKAMEQKGQRE